jgi:hypothetical protein
MFEAIIHARRVRRLQKEKRRIQAAYKRILHETKAANTSELELERLFFEERMKIQIVDAEIHQLITQRLIQIAVVSHFDCGEGGLFSDGTEGSPYFPTGSPPYVPTGTPP